MRPILPVGLNTGFWRPIGFANTGFCIFAILRDFCVSVATQASGMS